MNWHMIRRGLLALGILLAAACPAAAYPDRVVRIVVPYPPGGDLLDYALGDPSLLKVELDSGSVLLTVPVVPGADDALVTLERSYGGVHRRSGGTGFARTVSAG